MDPIQYNGATITLKPATVRTRLHASAINNHFNVTKDMPTLEWISISQYTSFLSRATIDGDLGFYVPNGSASEDDYRRGLEAFLDAPELFYDTVVIALLLMDDADGTNEAALTPDVSKKT